MTVQSTLPSSQWTGGFAEPPQQGQRYTVVQQKNGFIKLKELPGAWYMSKWFREVKS